MHTQWSSPKVAHSQHTGALSDVSASVRDNANHFPPFGMVAVVHRERSKDHYQLGCS
jgi:hypothetical protein